MILLDFSQCASQIDWLVPELVKIVTELYYDDLITLNYDII